jgi:hypothetical protein
MNPGEVNIIAWSRYLEREKETLTAWHTEMHDLG